MPVLSKEAADAAEIEGRVPADFENSCDRYLALRYLILTTSTFWTFVAWRFCDMPLFCLSVMTSRVCSVQRRRIVKTVLSLATSVGWSSNER
jgi:hypothetical protein